MQPSSFRVVLDTNLVVAAGSRWLEDGFTRPTPDGNTCRRILIRVAETHKGLYCGKIIGEYLEKLLDRGHPPARAAKLITYLIGAFDLVAITTRSAPTPPSDPDDEVFLLCALDGQADYLVSDDHSLYNVRASYQPRPVIGRSTELADALGA